MFSALSQLPGGKGTYVEFTRGSLSVVEGVKGPRLIGRAWWGREMGQSRGRQDVSPLLMVTVKNGQVCTVWEDDTSPRAELEPPKRAFSTCHAGKEHLFFLLTPCREPGWRRMWGSLWLGREEGRTEFVGVGCVDGWRRGMSTSDSCEIALGLSWKLFPSVGAGAQNLYCQHAGPAS